MKTIEKTNVKTFLPVFPGFYNTLLEYNNESEDIQNEIDENRAPQGAKFEDFTFNYEERNKRAAEKSCEAVEEKLKELFPDIEINFEELISPTYYNYSNDHINVDILLSPEDRERLKQYLIKNKQEYKKHLRERYTSYSGFISSYSNSYYTWTDIYFKEIEENGHFLGAMLDFVLANEKFTDEDLYHKVSEDDYIELEYIKK